ncbi:hypothetical protein DSO57_1020192 [Entomophthora muscae]|uniref:Uncharacterized protein n=1 Tax=Entomophthora muscae TaxID=34485 RepID=A0ACC2TRA1_9FUNG|nr:hypothetical protein DSO57_1020192 [Entomophthora muscae]
MLANIAKCGYIPVASGSRSTMLWNNTALPLIKLYTYLGFPHTANGIQVAKLATAAANKVSASMSMLSGVAYSWTPLVWTTVYCTFFRSQMDYPLPLLFFANKFAKSPATMTAFVCLKKVHTQAMTWCTNISDQSLITSAITFILTLANRVYHLATCFALHVENLAFDSSLYLLRPTRPQIISFEQSHCSLRPQIFQSLAQRIDSAKLLAKLPTLSLVNGTPATLMNRIHVFYVHQYAKPNNSCMFITIDACTSREIYRSSNLSPDQLLCIQDQDQIHLALSSRCNTFGFRLNCVCGKHFSCPHIHRCGLFEDYHVDLTQHWDALAQDIIKHLMLSGTSYSIMDSLLNHTKHDLFDQTLMFLLIKLVNCPHRGLVPHCECSSPNGSSGSESDMPCSPDVLSVTPAKRADASSSTLAVKLCRILTHAKLAEDAALPTPPVSLPPLGDTLLVIDANSVPEPLPVLVPTSDLAPVFLHVLILPLAQNTSI